MHINAMPVVLKYYGNAHTDSDIFAHFTDADILQTGDTFWNGSYPSIDYSTGGSIDGQIRAAEKNLVRATDKTVVIPGHGPVGGRTDLTIFRDVPGRNARHSEGPQEAGAIPIGGYRR